MAQDQTGNEMRKTRQDWFACALDRPEPDGSNREKKANSQLGMRVTDHSSRF
jgi:hypothetical protein